jgi:hypothetical protein
MESLTPVRETSGSRWKSLASKCHNWFEDRPIIEGLTGFDLLDDKAMNRLWLAIDKKFRFRPTKDFFWTVVFDEAYHNAFHPVSEYLDGLKWDGVKRIDKWLINTPKPKIASMPGQSER